MSQIYHYSKQVIDLKWSSVGALFIGGIVYFINLDYGALPALIAASKQSLYTFFVGGFMLKLLEMLVMRIHPKWAGVIISAFLVSALTCSLIYGVHSFKGTPKPWESTIPTVILAPFSFLVIAWVKRTRRERKKVALQEE